MAFLKYSPDQFYALQEIQADFYAGRWTLPQAVDLMRSVKVAEPRMIIELFNTCNNLVHDSAQQSKVIKRQRYKSVL